MPIIELMAEHQRISILISLNESPDYGLNSSILGDILDRYAIGCSRDQLHTQLNWLEQNGYVSIDRLSNNTWVASITQTGADVATGRSVVPGIKRPGPRSK
ncbi:hypothetical protein DS891_24210 [Pseudoalteromonas sp. JC28]|uniref:VpaChn25_0724 family phage protein n=1 Tax=Pseudoalteromonas TaxID=53246 RepID=UPI00110AE94C|nr:MULTISPECIES: hypothetical protein [unclassified Pseudoalteromonas]MCG9761434.1 hypothetical protein [Pseudoalteromonas sp. Isolate6]NSY36527.1 hypothetical protein [Pseudoalteromonas sp. JC28]NSY36565.1 hypothetical protein [Pseudoalteromonas sp. JC28]NSY36590.1 hypothetical protein [Pseudoalteromonas sp. JC28]TMN39081.1 hypothetical protein CWC03_10335 [Pseudoalteromonas sp. S2755]